MKNTFKTVAITGAGSGIGRALAQRLAPTCSTMLLFGRTPEKLGQTRILCEKQDPPSPIIHTYCIDLTDVDHSAQNFQNIFKDHPTPDLVIANAGFAAGASGENIYESYQTTKRQMDVNFLGAIAFVQACLPKMQAQKSGHIAFVSSIAAISALPYCAGYSASKAALLSYGKSLHTALRSENIHVSTILPGFVDTEMEQNLTGWKPFKITADQAAQIIINGLHRNKHTIAFPKRLYLMALLGRIIPKQVYDRAVTKMVMRVKSGQP